ncbi:hypothetical protein BGZ76_001540 [Entomortierella beljakovae]|nr:hypothetical protein BGZ76_001540 [Entomortierella beljakovae]
MDNLGFQGMPRFPLTPAEEALVPRPHASASQVATALPSTYTRRGSTSLSSSPSQTQLHHSHNHHGRPQYTRKYQQNQQNHPYSSSNQGGSRIFSFSFSSSSNINRNQQQSPSPPSPTSPSYNHTTFNSTESEEQEYPQNPQDGYYPRTHTPTPVPIRSSSTEPLPRKSFSLSPRAARPPSPQLYNDLYENTSYQRQYSTSHPHHRGSMDSNPRPGSPSRINQGQLESWGSTVRVESPVQMSDSESSQSESKEIRKDVMMRRPSQYSPGISSTAHENPMEAYRTSLESEHATTTRFSYESQRDVISKPNHNKSGVNISNMQDVSDEERQELKRARPSWRPSLSLIRQEGSSFNVLPSMQDQKRYPQNDQRRISETPGLNESPKNKVKRHRRKKKKGSSSSRRRRGHDSVQEYNAKGNALPTLSQVLEKRTRYPLSYDDFEAFLRSQRAVEYLNFWADVTAHEQLCRTFNISERRLQREYQLEERAIARDRRRFTRPTDYDAHQNNDGTQQQHQHQQQHHQHQENWSNSRNRISEQGGSINNSNLYINVASRSSIQLPTHDHLSFPPESRRYGTQDSPSSPLSIPVYTSQRRGSEQRAAGAYNRLLAGVNARKTSLEASRHSLDGILNEHDVTPTDSTPTSHQIAELTQADGHRTQGRKPSVVEYFGNGIKGSTSQLSLPPSPTRQDQNLNEEMTQLAEAVVDLIPPPNRGDLYMGSYQISQQSLKIVEPSTPLGHRKRSIARMDSLPQVSPLGIRRSGESAYAPSPYSTVHDGRPLLAQSYRTISLEDLEESALRIYRKYLIQLRTASMAREEEEAARELSNNVPNDGNNNSNNYNTNSSGASSIPALGSISEKGILAPGWEGYAEQMITEWDQRWRGRSAEARRARRMSGRKHPSEKEKRNHLHGKLGSEKEVSQSSSQTKTGEDSSNIEEEDSKENNNAAADFSDDENGNSTLAGRTRGSRRPKVDRNATATGISSFILRLLRSETTVLELPTLTVNTTTVVTDADESFESEYDEYDEYESEDEDDLEESNEGGDTKRSRNRHYDAPVKALQSIDVSPVDNIVEGSDQGDVSLSEIETNNSAIQLQRLASRQYAKSHQTPNIPIREMSEKPTVTKGLAEGGGIGVGTRTVLETQLPEPGPNAVARSAAAAAFYLPLECRERIHTQIHQEKRMDGTHVFGPAKGFVVEIVLRDYYYPLFLKHVKRQNLGLLHQSHVNNRIKRRGMMIVGAALCIIVIAIQLTLVLMGWGGWTRPWVWVVGIIGGWPGTICLATGFTGFSPVLGVFGKM